MRRVALVLACSAIGVAVAVAAAQTSPLRVDVAELATLSPGDHAEVVVEVHVDAAARGPLLVTPSVDGAAVEVVRGRLFRFDAEDPDADPLRFRVPITAMSIGTAVLLVRVDGHACEGTHCEPVEAEARRAIEVR
jgi:hypothetical protein